VWDLPLPARAIACRQNETVKMRRREFLGTAVGATLGTQGVLSWAVAAQQRPTPQGWLPLVSGDQLDGWYTFIDGRGRNADTAHVFTVRDGVVHVYKDSPDGAQVPAGFIATEREYSRYHFRLEYKWGTKRFAPRAQCGRDAGILYHAVGRDQIWPQSVECQIMEGDTGDVFTVGTVVSTTVDPATKQSGPRFLEPAAGGVPHTQGNQGITRIIKGRNGERPGWNRVEVVVDGPNSTYIVNGQIVNRCMNIRRPDPKDPQRLVPLTKGRILLQAEWAEVLYRNIEIKLLDAKATIDIRQG
jgi:hypothetical protein